ncbi:MAG: outer membrane beta-barrel protein [Gammaproteobacteria bacterium]|nr:outer membrane beta-barrel protein [Gammaproteobacteria bacterium]
MSRSLCSAAAALSLIAATPAASYGYDYGCDYCQLFPYSPVRVQFGGGRTITQGVGEKYLNNGLNVLLGLTWQPSSNVPLALRLDGMYQRFDARQALLTQAVAHFGTNVDEGTTVMWGGDVDAELDLPLTAGSRLYFLAGGGWYDEQNTFRYQGAIVSRNTNGRRFAKNAGLGLEFANGGKLFFFIEARYMRFNVNGQNLDLIPIRLGLRF